MKGFLAEMDMPADASCMSVAPLLCYSGLNGACCHTRSATIPGRASDKKLHALSSVMDVLPSVQGHCVHWEKDKVEQDLHQTCTVSLHLHDNK